MKTIRFVVPYFGKLPSYFQIWLNSCKANPTVSWIVFTDDKTNFAYPENVQVEYTSFEYIKKLIDNNYDFDITLEMPYKLCDYKIAYGEIFQRYLHEFDFWGFCDIDLIWGNIREFYTEELLSRYAKIGCRGHAMIFKNTPENNQIYRTDVSMYLKENGTFCETYEEAFLKKEICATDRELIKFAYQKNKIESYDETIYAGLQKYESGFFLQGMSPEEDASQKRQVFLWENGRLTRYYLLNSKIMHKDYLYIHFFARPMQNRIDAMDRILIYPDCYKNFYEEVTEKVIRKYGKKSILLYYWRVMKQNKKRIGVKKILSFFKTKMTYNKHVK